MNEIIKRLIAIITVLFLSLLLNKATTLDQQSTLLVSLGLQILVIIFGVTSPGGFARLKLKLKSVY